MPQKKDRLRVFVCTHLTQGHRPNDFCWAEDNEPLVFAPNNHAHDLDDACGCGRTMYGTNSLRRTTTMLVAAWHGTRDDLVATFAGAIVAHGWLNSTAAARLAAEPMVDYVTSKAARHDLGTVVEWRGTRGFVARTRSN